ncbi:hypothetical protein GAYE_SCF20G4104 [Galdieria yellowstonensis]|uniref:Uncharacterized protein n=1 Tax=Galdieria yellowstonensis TaxID=3028027 RepID=A0AAV9IFQ6_9RHOD|nr:hypothetical protein GAYE_SCF20G4104 [Galdieria yellowstonensis]
MLKTTHSSDSFYKKQIEQLTKEKKQLKERLELLESENNALRRSVFELSVSKASKEPVLDLEVALIPNDDPFKNISSSLQPPHSHPHPDYYYRLNNTFWEGYVHNSMEWDWREPRESSFSRFGWKYDLAGHLGAVYVVKFSKCARWIASGSQDKSIRIWQLDKPTESALVLWDAHASSISDLCWNVDNTMIATCGYDRQVKEWSFEQGLKNLCCYSLPGLVQDVEYCVGQPCWLFASTSQGNICLLDRRTPPPPTTTTFSSSSTTNNMHNCIIQNDCSVNSIHVHYDGIFVTSGDHRGCIQRWDIRHPAKPLEVFYNSKRPISHLTVSREQYLAVNSFDNTIRVYDRGGYLLGSQWDSLKLVHTLKGIKSQNWPIKSSFYQGADFLRFPPSLSSSGASSSSNWKETSNSNNTTSTNNNNNNNSNNNNIVQPIPVPSNYRPQETLTLASGSADGNIYIYDVGQPEGAACLVQCCYGHSDRVYDVCFHPNEPIFASSSADYLIKIWGPVKTATTTTSTPATGATSSSINNNNNNNNNNNSNTTGTNPPE